MLLQGDFFDWSPLDLAEFQILCKLAQNFSKGSHFLKKAV